VTGKRFTGAQGEARKFLIHELRCVKNIGAETMSQFIDICGAFFLKTVSDSTSEADDGLIAELSAGMSMSASTIRRIPMELAAATMEQLRQMVADLVYVFALDDHGNWGAGAHLVTDLCGWSRLAQRPVVIHVSNTIVGHSGRAGAENIMHYVKELNCAERTMGQMTDSTSSAIDSQANEMRQLLQQLLLPADPRQVVSTKVFYLALGCSLHVYSKFYEQGCVTVGVTVALQLADTCIPTEHRT